MKKTSNTRRGFTLIELLVVVLIIGILAAVAVPQYQKAVEKSKATQAMTLVKSIGLAAHAYYLANGEYPTDFSQLDAEIDWTGDHKMLTDSAVTDVRSNEEWSLQLNSTTGDVFASRLDGPYKAAGFSNSFKNNSNALKIRCFEIATNPGGSTFSKNPGDYCEKLFHAQSVNCSSCTNRYYWLP